MRPHNRLLCAALVIMLPGHLLPAQVTWFTDGFQRRETGPAWHSTTGSWQITGGTLRIDTREYDQMIVCSTYVYGTTLCTLHVSLRGLRGGVFFNIHDRTTKNLAHMVRFDEKSLLAGYFNGAGEYVATSIFDIPETAADWTLLQIVIEPAAHRYAIAVNETIVGIDTTLRFPSGYVGLQGSDGTCEFRFAKITAALPQRPLLPLLPGDTPPLRHITSVRRSDGGVAVHDRERNELLHMNRQGSLLRIEPGAPPPIVSRHASAEGRRYSLEGRAILVRDGSGTTVDSITDRLVAPASLLMTGDGRLLVTDPGAGGILAFGPDGEYRTTFAARLLGGFIAPRGMDFLSDDTLVVADYNRLVLVPITLADPAPRVSFPSPAEALIEWESAAGTPGRVRFAPDGGQWTTYQPLQGSDRGSYRVGVGELSPLTRYSFTLTPTLTTIPSFELPSRELRFVTPPADPATRAVTRLPALCMVYRTITYRDVYPKDRFPAIPDGRRISDDELDYLREACRFNTEFYYRNSGCSVVLDFDFHVVEDTLRLHEVGPQDPYWLSVNERVTRDFELAAAAHGKTPEHYNGLIVPYAWVNHPPRRTSALRDPSRGDSITIRQLYGGGTYGVPAPWKYGKTSGYTGNPFQDRFSRQDWLITHEFHHQIDALMEASGYPEYYHADQPWKMPGGFGEDFDFNALIIRKAGRDPWLSLRFGSLATVRDTDRDGVPDSDSSLPFDELRIGSSAADVDSDGDGLGDLGEVMAGAEHGSDPRRTDTDGDGVRDDADREPLHPVDLVLREIPRGEPDGIKRVTEIPFVQLDSSTVLYLCADDSALYAGYSFSHPDTGKDPDLGFLFQIDGKSDGWFHGFDNTQVRVRWSGDSVKVVDYYLRDCASWSDPPKDRKDILDPSDLRIERITEKREDDPAVFTLVVRIPFNPLYGPVPEPDGSIAVRFGFQTTEDRWVWQEAFERNEMVAVRWSGNH